MISKESHFDPKIRVAPTTKNKVAAELTNIEMRHLHKQSQFKEPVRDVFIGVDLRVNGIL